MSKAVVHDTILTVPENARRLLLLGTVFDDGSHDKSLDFLTLYIQFRACYERWQTQLIVKYYSQQESAIAHWSNGIEVNQIQQ